MKDKFITLKCYETVVEAMFDKELLEVNKIECAINNENSVELLPMFGEINEGLRIVVFEKDYETALQILSDYNASIDK